MRKPDNYKAFQDRIFDEIGELEKRKSLIVVAAEEYGLTMKDVRRIYRPGMNGPELEEAMRIAGEEKKKAPQKAEAPKS